MPKTERISGRITSVTRAHLDELAAWWGPVTKLSDAGVIAEAVWRAWQTEADDRRKKNRKSESTPH